MITTKQTQTEALINHLVTRALSSPVPMISPKGVHVIIPCTQVATRLASGYAYCADKACRHSDLVSRG